MSRKLKPKQKKAAWMLSQGLSARYVAATIKVRPETLSRWKRLPEFKLEIEKFMQEERNESRHKLACLADASISAIWSELHDNSSGSKRLRAALNVLNLVANERIPAPNMPKMELPAPKEDT